MEVKEILSTMKLHVKCVERDFSSDIEIAKMDAPQLTPNEIKQLLICNNEIFRKSMDFRAELHKILIEIRELYKHPYHK